MTCLWMSCLLHGLAAPEAAYLTVPTSAWRLALADLGGEERRLVYGAYEGAVGCLVPDSGELLWESPVGGFPFALATGDLDGDGRDEILAACSDGMLTCFDAAGHRRWQVATGKPLYNVAVGRVGPAGERLVVCGGIDRVLQVLDRDGQQVAASPPFQSLVHRVACGDLDGDGRDEIVAFDGRTTAIALNMAADGLHELWRGPIELPEMLRNWENPRGQFNLMSLDLADLDGDDRAELVGGDSYHNRQVIVAARASGELLWNTAPLPLSASRDRWYEFYSTAFVRVADFRPDHAGPEIVSVSGGLVRLHDKDGKELARAEAPVGFSDLVVDGRTLYLGSTPGGDNTIYRVSLDGDWPAEVRGLRRHGRAATVADNLAALRQQVVAAAPEPTAPEGWDFEMSLADDATRRLWRTRLPYDGLRLVGGRKVIEPTPPLTSQGEPFNASRWKTDSLPGTQTVERIEAIAKQIEAGGEPVGLSIGHSCMPFVTLDTIDRILAAAPTQVVNFVTAEDEDPRLVKRYLDEFIGPLADRCAKHGSRVRVVLKNKGLWWLTQPAEPAVFEALFAPGRGEVLVAATEDSNSRTPELNLFARVGLRQAGLMQFRVSIHQDLFSYCRFQQYEYPKTGSPYLRLLVAQTVLGGTDYRAHGMFTYGRGDDLDTTVLGEESIELFGHLLGKGLVRAPAPEELASLSTVGLVMHEPPEDWLADAHNGHAPQRWRDDPALDDAVLPHNGCTWGNSPTPPHALQALLFRKTRQFGTYVPATPYGAVAMVPAGADLAKVVGVRDWWHTDGVALWRDGGPRLTGQAAYDAAARSFEQAAQELPFRAHGDDVFCQVHRMGDGQWRVFLVDPGWVDPREREVRLAVQVPGNVSLTDRLTGEALPVADGQARLLVPAGGLRIVDARSGE